LLGQGIPLFSNVQTRVDLKPLDTKAFSCGVTALHYSIE
jgi:hypothetical protein